MKITQNPKLAHVEKLIEALAGKVRQTLDEQSRISHNPETALAGAQKIERQLTEAYNVAFEASAPILSSESEETTGWHITAVSSVRNLARNIAPMASIFTYVNEGTPEFSAIWQPKLLSLSYACKGLGAFSQNTGRLRMSTQEELGANTVIALPWATADAVKPLETAAKKGFHTRKSGCVAADILTVAGGHADAGIATQLSPAASGAFELFMKEAGGKVTLKNDAFIASNIVLHADVVKTFK